MNPFRYHSYSTYKYYINNISRKSGKVNSINKYYWGDFVYFRRLRDLREDSDLKQVEVAEYLGIAQTVYSRYERGFQTIPVEHLLRLADFYNVSTDYILGRTNKPAFIQNK